MGTKIKSVIIAKSPKFIVRFCVATKRKLKLAKYRCIALVNRKEVSGYCSCCNTRLRQFTQGEFLMRPERYNVERYKNTRLDVICPVCKSMPRHRILASWCNDHVQLLQSSNILYFAPEYCMSLWMKSHRVKCATSDLCAEADYKLDIQRTGLPDASYSMVICNHVLEHVDDFRMALNELYRILQPGGMLICSFPMDPKVELLDEDPSVTTEEERLARFGQNDHKRVFGMKAEQFLTEAGFEVERIDGDECPDEIVPVVGPADYDINRLFYCKKKI